MENLQNKQKTYLTDFVIFILSHENPKVVKTYKSLKRFGYTGNWYIVLDDTDSCYDEYVERFGKEKILVFNKSDIAKTFDGMDLSTNYDTVVYARNACFELARKLGYNYFMELDDDYREFNFRFDDNGVFKTLFPTNLDIVFEALLEYYINTPKLLTLAIAQMGDFLGGSDSSKYKKRYLRKAMNTFICSVDRPFTFIGRINEDVNTYCTLGSRGELIATVVDVSINQIDTQHKVNNSGMSNIYIRDGTYAKSFYPVICCPSFVKIGIVGNNHARIHHNIDWKHAVPMIISDRFKKV